MIVPSSKVDNFTFFPILQPIDKSEAQSIHNLLPVVPMLESIVVPSNVNSNRLWLQQSQWFLSMLLRFL